MYRFTANIVRYICIIFTFVETQQKNTVSLPRIKPNTRR